MNNSAGKVANSFFLPRRSLLRGIASLLDYSTSDAQEFTEHILARSNAEAIGADWEIVGQSLEQAAKRYTDQLEEDG